MTRRLNPAAEHGYTMIAVMMVLLATSMLAGAAFAFVGGDIPFARASQDRKQAYAAAEAGVEYYLYQLARDNDYWTHCDQVDDPGDGQPSPVNLENPGASRTWRAVSGAKLTDAKFSIELLPANGEAKCDPSRAEDTMLDKSSGTFRIRSTGVARGVKRSIVATLRRTSFLDYLYFTDYEASDPLTFPSATDRTYAANNCVKYRNPRNQNTWCRDNTNITFQDWDFIHGPLHTNDDLLTCGEPEFGRDVPGKIDRIEIVGPATNGYTVGSGCSGPPKFFGPVRQPAQYLPVPTSNKRLAAVAETGYLFSGQTVIRFDGSANMSVTTYTNGVANTETKALPKNGVIYVETADGPACTLDAPRQIDYPTVDSTNWRCPVLTVKGTYPKSMTLGSEGDILIDGDIEKSGDVVLGLVAQRFVRVKHPVGDPCGSNGTGTMNSVTIEAAILALADSFIVDNYACGSPLANLTVTGAIAQKFRGPVGTFNSSKVRNHGYAKQYEYDDRLRYRSPPYFLDPIVAAWRVVRSNEQVPAAK
jgi:type II secretory pathway pseudopilin PulG